MNTLHKVFLALLLVATSLGVAWAAGRLEAGAGAPYAQFETSTVTVVDAQVLAVPGFLQCIMFSQADAAPTAGTIILYDNTAESGTVVFSHTFTTAVFMPFQICPQRPLTTGLYIGMTTTGDVNVIVSYKK